MYERHLQRRHKNPLFNLKQRNVTTDEFEAAKRDDQRRAGELIASFEYDLECIREQAGNDDKRIWDTVLLEKIQNHIISLISTGDEQRGYIDKALDAERILVELILKSYPHTKRYIDALGTFNLLNRLPVIAQFNQPNSPIKKDELAESILSEDLNVVRICFFFQKYNNPGYLPEPIEAKLKVHLASKSGMPFEDVSTLKSIIMDNGLTGLNGLYEMSQN